MMMMIKPEGFGSKSEGGIEVKVSKWNIELPKAAFYKFDCESET